MAVSHFNWGIFMRLITIETSYLKSYSVRDKEMLHNAQRPCGLIIQLKYKERRYDFAIPFRSNISPSTPKDQYFPLPTRYTTREKHRHGLHYTKMFPIRRTWTYPFHIDNNIYAALIKGIIDKNEKKIIADCQAYLQRYENGDHPQYSTDIDKLIDVMEHRKAKQ